MQSAFVRMGADWHVSSPMNASYIHGAPSAHTPTIRTEGRCFLIPLERPMINAPFPTGTKTMLGLSHAISSPIASQPSAMRGSEPSSTNRVFCSRATRVASSFAASKLSNSLSKLSWETFLFCISSLIRSSLLEIELINSIFFWHWIWNWFFRRTPIIIWFAAHSKINFHAV